MRTPSKTRKAGRGRSNLGPLVLIGIGLILLGAVGFILLPKPGKSQPQTNQNANLPLAIPLAVDAPAPELRLSDLEGKPVALSDFSGQWVLLNNWATWCPPCKAEMPALQAFHDAHQGQNLTVLAVNMGESEDKVARFAADYQLSFPVWPDPEERLYEAFKNISLPTSWVIDPSGQIRLTWTGAISREVLEEYVTPLLEE